MADFNQIQFPAIQVPSTDPNALDDYEEGTFTPTLSFATPGNLAVTYSIQSGRYTKVGRECTVHFIITTSTFTHTTAAGPIQISGLPFVAFGDVNTLSGGACLYQGYVDAARPNLIAVVESAQSICGLRASGSGVALTNATASAFPTGGTVLIVVTLTYTTA